MGLAKAYLFCGEEEFLKEEAAKKTISSLLQDSSRELDYDTYNAKDQSKEIFGAINTPPFLSKKRVVVIRDIEDLPEREKPRFIEYLKSSQETTSLILLSRQKSPETRFLKDILDHAKSFVLKKPRFNEMKEWIQDRLKACGKSMHADALELLLELKRSEGLAGLSNELEKLIIYKGDEKLIRREDVTKLVGKGTEKRVFDLIDAISMKDAGSALSVVREIASIKRQVPEVLGLIGWQLRRIWKARVLLDQKIDRSSIAAELNIRSFSVNKFFRQVERFDRDGLKKGFKLLVWADHRLKRGKATAETILEGLILRLTQSI